MQTPRVSPRVRLIFVAAVALLTAQSLFLHLVGEPYPAITMPAFPGSGGYRDGGVELRRYEAVFVADGEEFSFPSKVLLAEFPDSHHGMLAHTSLRPPGELSQLALSQLAASGGRFARLRTLLPGFTASRMSRGSPENMASLREWLRGRARVLVPDRPVSRVEIRWFRERFRADGTGLEASREPAGTLVVPLGGELR